VLAALGPVPVEYQHNGGCRSGGADNHVQHRRRGQPECIIVGLHIAAQTFSSITLLMSTHRLRA
jgi:hypothetical protein